MGRWKDAVVLSRCHSVLSDNLRSSLTPLAILKFRGKVGQGPRSGIPIPDDVPDDSRQCRHLR
jgi:hypothetical protein